MAHDIIIVFICMKSQYNVIQNGHQTQTASHPLGWLFCLAEALVASKLAPRAKQRRIRFAFEPKAVSYHSERTKIAERFVSRTFSSEIPNTTLWRWILALLRFRLRSGWHGRKSARRSRGGICKAARRRIHAKGASPPTFWNFSREGKPLPYFTF